MKAEQFREGPGQQIGDRNILVLRIVYQLCLYEIPVSASEETCSMLRELTPTGCPEASRAEAANPEQHLHRSLLDDKSSTR